MSKKKWITLGIIVLVLAGVTVFIRNWSSGFNVIGRKLSIDTSTYSENLDQSITGPQAVGGAFNYGSPGFSSPSYYPPYYPDTGDALQLDQRAYEVYGSFSLVMDDVAGYFNKTKAYILSINGRVMNFQTGTQGRFQTGYMTAKVPVDKFDEATAKIVEGVRSIENQQVSSTDVTGRVDALKTQLANLEDQKAVKEIELVEAKTEVERRRIELEIKRLEQQIEQYKAQDEVQTEQVEYATLSISAASSKSVYDPSARPDLRDELDRAYNSVLDNLFVIAQFMIWVVVYGAVIIPLVILAGALKRKSNKKTEAPIK